MPQAIFLNIMPEALDYLWTTRPARHSLPCRNTDESFVLCEPSDLVALAPLANHSSRTGALVQIVPLRSDSTAVVRAPEQAGNRGQPVFGTGCLPLPRIEVSGAARRGSYLPREALGTVDYRSGHRAPSATAPCSICSSVSSVLRSATIASSASPIVGAHTRRITAGRPPGTWSSVQSSATRARSALGAALGCSSCDPGRSSSDPISVICACQPWGQSSLISARARTSALAAARSRRRSLSQERRAPRERDTSSPNSGTVINPMQTTSTSSTSGSSRLTRPG